jgi:hypothetical protein
VLSLEVLSSSSKVGEMLQACSMYCIDINLGTMIDHPLLELQRRDQRPTTQNLQSRPTRRSFGTILHDRQPSGSCKTGMLELGHALDHTVSPNPNPNENTANAKMLAFEDSTYHC